MFKIILILVLGSLGGFLIQKAAAPYLFANYPYYNEGGTTIINKTEKVVIEESQALEEAIQKIKSSIVLVSAGSASGGSQSGFIISSDGLIATAKNLDGQVKVFWQDKIWPAKVMKELKGKITFLKMEANNLPVIAIDDREPKLGQTVFIIGLSKSGNYFVNSGVIKRFDEINIVSNLKEDNVLSLGSPLVNLRGEVMAIVYDIKPNEIIAFRGIDKLF